MTDDDNLRKQAGHLYDVEGLSIRQIALQMGVSRKKAARLIGRCGDGKKKRSSIIEPYGRLIEDWYERYPSLRATQIFARLQSYGFSGKYTTVKEYTRQFRRKRKRMYHELTFLPGEEAQVDWMQRRFDFGVAHGFIFILSYSRYLYGHFYPAEAMEFFLEGHIGAFAEINGIPHRGRYDNLKSVVLRRKPEIVYNAQFLDFTRHYGFSLYACTPARANEKGRVERVIQDIGRFLEADTFADLTELNRKFTLWRKERNQTVHRATGKTPDELLKEEKLQSLPQIRYQGYRHKQAMVSSTGFISFETNRYSVPSRHSNTPCSLLIYPRYIEIVIQDRKVAFHQRSFLRQQTIENPQHRERVLTVTPHFKYQRIQQLMQKMDKSIDHFLTRAEAEGEDPQAVSYELFKLLPGRSKYTLLSAIKEANKLGTFKAAYIRNLLQPSGIKDNPVYPQNEQLLHINYERSPLTRYDELI